MANTNIEGALDLTNGLKGRLLCRISNSRNPSAARDFGASPKSRGKEPYDDFMRSEDAAAEAFGFRRSCGSRWNEGDMLTHRLRCGRVRLATQTPLSADARSQTPSFCCESWGPSVPRKNYAARCDSRREALRAKGAPRVSVPSRIGCEPSRARTLATMAPNLNLISLRREVDRISALARPCQAIRWVGPDWSSDISESPRNIGDKATLRERARPT